MMVETIEEIPKGYRKGKIQKKSNISVNRYEHKN